METPIETIVKKHFGPVQGDWAAPIQACITELLAHFSEIFGRWGVDVTKTGAYSKTFLNDQRRHAVMMLISPPVALKDAPLDLIEQTILGKYYRREDDSNACLLLKKIALEIYKSYSAAPLDAAATQVASEVLAAHARQMRKGP